MALLPIKRRALCSVAPSTKGVFTIARLDGLFEFAEDRFTALASLKMIG